MHTQNSTLLTAHFTLYLHLHLHLYLHLYTSNYTLNNVHYPSYIYITCWTFITSHCKHQKSTLVALKTYMAKLTLIYIFFFKDHPLTPPPKNRNCHTFNVILYWTLSLLSLCKDNILRLKPNWWNIEYKWIILLIYFYKKLWVICLFT